MRSALRPNRLMSESGSTVDQSLVVRLLAIGYIWLYSVFHYNSQKIAIDPDHPWLNGKLSTIISRIGFKMFH